MNRAEELLYHNDDEGRVPFAYIKASDSKNREIWAVISAPPDMQTSLSEAVRNAKTRNDRVNLPSLIRAFHGEITAKGYGDVPEDIESAFSLLYHDRDDNETTMDL